MKIKIKTEDMMRLIEETLNDNQQAIFRVQGFSMEPFLKDNVTSVTLEKKKSYQVNDIVLFKHNVAYKLHRLVRIKKGSITCKGDYLISKEHAHMNDIIGYVVSYETNGKIVFVDHFSYKVKVIAWRLLKPVLIRVQRILRKFKLNK